MPRQQLIAQLNQTLPRKLTVLSAPAGYGKTTLAVRWLQDHSFVWVSLDTEDNDPARFLTYVSVGFKRQDPTLASTAVAILQEQTGIDPIQIIHILINDLAQRTEPIYLVLDDYHLITDPTVHRLLSTLLDYAPPSLHVVVTSRMELPFSISRYRVRHQAVELRTAQLRFSEEETALFLNELMHLDLTPEEVAALEGRTEGWAASLQLAALSLSQQNRPKRTEFIERFAGSNRYIMDYLVDEVLGQQSAADKQFLTRTAVLRRFSSALCTAVNGASHETSLIDFDRANLFLIPLDDSQAWFRYHHLFAELLRHQLKQSEPELIPQLHKRAADWFAANGYLDDALFHALEAPDYAQAAALLAAEIEDLVTRGDISRALHYINQIPEEHRHQNLSLNYYYAWVLMFVGRLEESQAVLNALPKLPNPDAWPLEPLMTVLRGYLATRTGQFDDGIRYSKQGYDQLSRLAEPGQTARIMRGAAAMNLVNTYTFVNDLEQALAHAEEAANINLRVGNTLGGLAAVSIAVQINVTYGHLRQAERLAKQGLAAAERVKKEALSDRRPLAAAPLLRDLGHLYLQWNQINQAADYLEEAAEMYRMTGATNVGDGLASLLELYWARQDIASIESILATLDDLRSQAPPDYRLRRINAAQTVWQTRLISLGGQRLSERAAVAAWAQENESLATKPLNFRFEFETRALVAAWLCLGETSKVLALLTRLASFAAESKRRGDLWSIDILTILTLAQQGESAHAIDRLEKLLTDTEPERAIRLYVNEGEAMATLLAQCRPTPYRDQLLAAFTSPEEEAQEENTEPPEAQSLVEPLSSRERQVLDLLATGATNQQIADSLVISYTTAKKHVSNIIGKLGVNNRSTAVARARELKLIP